ncbi:MAG: response regulator, partial [Oscillospiraceae bacterium]|nr:response regulator [Oscillospiraceae bacterium]
MYNVVISGETDRYIREIEGLDFWEKNAGMFTIKCTSTDGNEVIRLLDDKDIHIIITDVDMEKPNGFDILKAAEEKGRCICVILTGEKADFHIVRKALTHYAFDYLIKPVTDKALSDSLERAMKRFEKKLLNKSMSDVDYLCNDIVDCMMNGGTDLNNRLEELIKKCTGSEDGYISNIQKLRNIAEKIYNDVCIIYEWVYDLIPEPAVILKNTNVSD